MRRWNGWGDDAVETSLPPRARELLESLIGPGTPPRDATLDEVVATVPPSRLAADPALDDDPRTRVRHARGPEPPRLGRAPDRTARRRPGCGRPAGRRGGGPEPHGARRTHRERR